MVRHRALCVQTMLIEIKCESVWECGEWGECDNFLKNRTCTDEKSCEVITIKKEARVKSSNSIHIRNFKNNIE